MEMTDNSSNDYQMGLSILQCKDMVKSAAQAGNWNLVNELTSGGIAASNVKQSLLLESLASATGISYWHLRDILSNVFSCESQSKSLICVAENALVRAAYCDNWDVFIVFLSMVYYLLEDETSLLSVIQLMASSQTLREKPYLHVDVLTAVWRCKKQSILNSTNKRIHNTLVQLAAELNMWSRVCDLLITKPDVNLLDRDGLSVLHRLVMCPDSRFDSLLPVLLENGADVSLKSKKGDTMLHLAAKYQKLGEISHLAELDDCEQLKFKLLEEHHNRCTESKRQMLARLISSCHNLNDCDGQGNTAVIVAAENKNFEFLKLLLEHGARADIVDMCQRSVLHILALKQAFIDPLICRTLITLCFNKGAEVNSINLYWNSALHFAVKSQNWIFCEVMIDFSTDPECLDGGGYSILHRLAQTEEKYTENVCLLFTLLSRRGANLNTLNRSGSTALHIAGNQQNWTLVKHLISLGANIHLHNEKSFTILHIVAMTTTCSHRAKLWLPNQRQDADQTNLLSVVDLLLEKGADLEVYCSSGDTALCLAARHKRWFMVRYLIERGANMHAINWNGQPLFLQLISSKTDILDSLELFKLLYTDGTTRSVRSECGDSILQFASQHEKWSFVDVILKHSDMNVDEADSQDRSVLHRMATSQSETFKEGLSLDYVRTILGKSERLDKHQVVFLIHLAAAARNIDVVDELLDNFDDVNRTDDRGFTVLHRVAQCCSSTAVTIIRRLVVKGADVDKRCPAGDTALQLAAKSGNCLAVIQLLQSGAMVDSFDNEGMSILHRLIGQPQLYKLSEQSSVGENSICLLIGLLSEKTSINKKDPDGNTPLHLAIMFREWGMAIELLTRGASLNDLDSRRYTVLHRVAQAESCPQGRMETCHLSKPSVGHLDVLDLIDHGVDIDSRDPCGNTALMLSAAGNKWDSVDRLLKKGAAVVTHDMDGLTALHRLATTTTSSDGMKWNQRLLRNVLEDLISRGADVKARDPEGNTPIQLAAKHGNMHMVERLLEFQDNVSETDSEGFTLLSRVAQTSSPRCEGIAERLLKKGADVNMASSDGKTPLLHSVICRNWPVTSVLWHSGADSDTVLEQHRLILHHLIEDHSSELDLMDLIRKVVCGANYIAHRSSNGMSARQLAFVLRKWIVTELLDLERIETDLDPLLGELVFHGYAECKPIGWCLEELFPNPKLNMNLRDENGNTPLNIVARDEYWGRVEQFVQLGADPNMPDTDGWCVVHRLVMGHQRGNILHALVSNGANVNMVGPGGKTPLVLALEEEDWRVFWHLTLVGAEINWATIDRHLLLQSLYQFPKAHIQEDRLLRIIQHLTEETRSSQVQKAFVMCVRRSNWTVAKLLVHCRPDIEINKLESGVPLIHELVRLHKKSDHVTWLSFLTTLLNHGLDINSRDKKGKTALLKRNSLISFDRVNEPKALCRALLVRGADPLVLDNKGRSLLMMIMRLYGTHILKTVKWLLQVGLITNRPDLQGDPRSGQGRVSFLCYITQMKNALDEVEWCIFETMVEVGAFTNAELFFLHMEQEEMYESDTIDIRAILERAATEPRSLQALCRLALSRCLPCGLSRKTTVMSLPIPMILKEYLLFSDLMSGCDFFDPWRLPPSVFDTDDSDEEYYDIDVDDTGDEDNNEDRGDDDDDDDEEEEEEEDEDDGDQKQEDENIDDDCVEELQQ